ncbi:hypothetical protein ACJX0J_037035, partial [Zea mays]
NWDHYILNMFFEHKTTKLPQSFFDILNLSFNYILLIAGEQGTESYHYFNTKNYMFRKCAQTHEDLRSESGTDYFAIHNCFNTNEPTEAQFKVAVGESVRKA